MFAKLLGLLRPPVSVRPMGSENTIFGKIIRKELKAKVVYEDEKCMAFNDVTPQAPVHIILVPKCYDLPRLSAATPEHEAILGHLMCAAAKIAREQKLDKDGWRLVVNDGKFGQQTVPHLHLHIIGGRQFNWPPG